jgi:two-component system, NtrC family, sensor kinase
MAMRRRSRPNRKQTKARRRRAKTRNTSTLRRSSSAIGRKTEFERLRRERDEAQEREAATSEVLSVISSSPGKLEPVFDAVLENAVRLCEANFGTLFLYDGEVFATAALHRATPAYAEACRQAIVARDLHPNVPLARLARTKKAIWIADTKAEQGYVEHDPTFTEFVSTSGARAMLEVPMLKEDALIGAILVYRTEVQPFTDKQIALVQNFAAQAVIAIENARLLNELRQRTADLTESLEQQTATSEVLRVISTSPAELKPVFQSVLANATRLCEAKFGALLLCEADAFRVVALHNAPPAFAEFVQRGLLRPGPNIPLGRTAKTMWPTLGRRRVTSSAIQ